MESILSLGGLLVPIVAIIVGGAVAVTTMILRHQERVAKIERGIDPDAPPRGWLMMQSIMGLAQG
jgi:hypothetical protein